MIFSGNNSFGDVMTFRAKSNDRKKTPDKIHFHMKVRLDINSGQTYAYDASAVSVMILQGKIQTNMESLT